MGLPARGQGKTARRFERLQRLGEGGVGVVHVARDTVLGRLVALKTLRSPAPRSLLRFKREFRALADLCHPNLVELYGLSIDEDGWHIAMELVEGEPLLSYVGEIDGEGETERAAPTRSETWATAASEGDVGAVSGPRRARVERGAWRPDAAREARLRGALGQVMEALGALHGQQVLHRDVKPSNVLVERGRVVVLDFGLVAEPDEHGGRPFVGTPAYAAPEQLAGEPLDEGCDHYAVGVILYEALTGRWPYPYDGDVAALALRKRQFAPPPVRELAPAAPADLAALADALLARSPRERPDAAAIRRALGLGAGAAVAAPVFVGRKDEVEALEGALGRAMGGAFVPVLLRGPSGVGKTALARRFAEGARGRGAWVLEGRCYVAERVAFRGLDAVVDALARRLDALGPGRRAELLGGDEAALGRLFPVLGGGGEGAEPGDARRARWQGFDALRAVLRRMASEAPVVVLLDDAQWLDADGRELLAGLAEPEAPPMLLLVTARGDEAQALGELLPGAVEIELGPLPREAVVALVERLARLEAGGEAAAGRIADEAGGHPLLARELWRSRGEGAALGLDGALRARAEALEPGARAALEIVAVAGRPLRPDVVAEAAGLGPAEAARALGALRAQHLLRAVEVRGALALDTFHDRLREALLSSLDGPARRSGHERIARALLARGVDRTSPAELVLHLGEAGERERAVGLALDAARRARAALAFEQAVELARTGLALSPGDRGPALREELARALVGAGRGCEAAEQYQRLADEGPASRRSACLQAAAEQWLTSGEMERGLGALAAVVGPLPEGRLGLAGRLLLSRARSLRRPPPVRTPAQAERLARELDAVRTVAFGLGMIDNLRAAVFHARAYELARRLGDPERLGEVLATEAIFRGSLSTPRRRAAWALVEQARAVAPGAEGAQVWAAGAAAVLDTFEAPTERSIAELARSEEAFHGGIRAAGWARGSLFLIRALSRRLTGDFVALRREMQERVRDAEARGDLFLEVSLRRGSSILWLAAGDLPRLRDELSRCRWPGPEGGYHIQHWLALEASCERDLYEGNAAEALGRLQGEMWLGRLSLLGRLQRVRVLLGGLEGRLLLGRARGGALGRLDAARVAWLARSLDAEEVTYASAQACLLRAALARRAGDRGALVRELGRAVALSDEAGLQAHAACARLRWRALGLGAPPGPDPEAFFGPQRVRDPGRLAEVYAPGFW